MLPLVLVLALAGGSPEPPLEEPFLETGGLHLVFAHALHGLAVGGIFMLASTSPYRDIPAGWRVAGGLGLMLHVFGSGLLMAHFLRPSVGAAWLTVVATLASWFAGFSPASLIKRPLSSPFGTTTDPDTLVALAFGAGIGTLASLVILAPRDRSDVSGRGALLVMGGMVVISGSVALALATQGIQRDPYRQIALLTPIASAVVLRLAIGSFAPEPWISPQGSGLMFSGRF